MIKYNKIVPQTVDVYNKDGFFANVNEYEFNDIRIQIMSENATDFYVLFENERIDINSRGNLSNWPRGFFNLFEDQVWKLIEVRAKT